MCSRCNQRWCYMCECATSPGQQKWFFNTIPATCWGRGLGPGMCRLHHFAFFRVENNVRIKRSTGMFLLIAIPMCIFYILYSTILYLFQAMWWGFEATFNIFKNCSPFALILAPLVWIILEFILFFCYVFFMFCFVPFYMVFTVWGVFCRNPPANRNGVQYRAVNETQRDYQNVV